MILDHLVPAPKPPSLSSFPEQGARWGPSFRFPSALLCLSVPTHGSRIAVISDCSLPTRLEAPKRPRSTRCPQSVPPRHTQVPGKHWANMWCGVPSWPGEHGSGRGSERGSRALGAARFCPARGTGRRGGPYPLGLGFYSSDAEVAPSTCVPLGRVSGARHGLGLHTLPDHVFTPACGGYLPLDPPTCRPVSGTKQCGVTRGPASREPRVVGKDRAALRGRQSEQL